MGRGILIGRLFGTDIYCELTFFLLIGFYFWSAGAAAGALFSAAVLLSLLVHEFGHVFAVRRLLRTESVVVLWGLGGLCIYRGSPRPGQQAAISLMGPAFSLALGALSIGALAVAPPAPLLDAFLGMMVWINVAWTVVNLLPVVPLDGGQAFRAGLRSRLGRPRGDRVARFVSLAISAAATAVALLLDYRFAAFLAALLFLENLRRPDIAYH